MLGDYIVGRLAGRPVLPMGRALLGHGDAKLGVAYVTLDLSHLDQLLAGIEKRPGAVLTVVDSRGSIVGQHPAAGRAGLAQEAPIVKQMLAKRSGSVETTGTDGVRRIYAFTEVRAGGSPAGIMISAEIPREIAIAQVDRLFARSFIIYAVVGALGLIAAWVACELGVVRKLRWVAAAARRLQAGDLSARSGVKSGPDEVGVLAAAFDDMAHSLEALTRRNRLILESAGVGIYGVDRKGFITFVNPAAAELLGYAASELLGRASCGLIHQAECAPGDGQLLATLLDGARHRTEDAVFVGKDGKPIPVAVISTPIREGGHVIGAVIAFRDLTERKHLEAQLQHAQKMEAVGRLAGGVSHDFNNLLTVILSAGAELTRELAPGTELHETAQEVVTAATHAASLTRQLLSFSRKQVLQTRLLDPNAVVGGLRQILERLVGGDVEILTSLAATGRVRADAGQLEQVIVNLAVNARDAMPRGGRLTIETEDVELDGEQARGWIVAAPGAYVMTTVSDEGAGMDEATLGRLFEPFFTTKEPGKGTGLGLSMVWGIVKQSGGFIHVHSSPGKGSTFEVYLPRIAEASESCQPSAAAAAAAAQATGAVMLAASE